MRSHDRLFYFQRRIFRRVGASGAALILSALMAPGALASPVSEVKAQPQAAEPSLESELSSIQKQKDVKGIFSSNFDSTFWSARTQRTRQSTGKVSYQAPNLFRWEIESPEREIYVSTGTELWKHNLSAKHAQELPLREAGLEFLKAIVDPAELTKMYEIKAWDWVKKAEGETSASADFDIRPDAATKSTIVQSKFFASLVPRRADAAEKYLYLIADKKSGQVDEIRIAFQNGNTNTIRFKNWEQREGSGELFKFDPPPGTAVDRVSTGKK